MLKKLSVFAFGLLLMSQAHLAAADVGKEGWDTHFSGYVELSSIFDTTRSFTEILNNGPVAVPGANAANNYGAGDNGRTQMSLRQTRLYLKANAPDMDGWKLKGWIEGDFLGVDPAPYGTTNVSQSEAAFVEQGTFRMRNAFVTANKDSWHVLVGQWWSMFGYQPYYVIFNTSTSTPINIIQRQPQIKLTKDMEFSDSFKWQWDASIERPTQRDSTIPNLNAGAKAMYTGRKSGRLLFDGGEWSVEPTSLAVSGTYRGYTTPNTDANPADKMTYTGGGVAVSAFVPILTSDDGKTMKNNLAFQGEYVYASGIADNYTGFTGGMAAFTGGNSTNPNLDAGIGGFDSAGNFQLVQTNSFTAQFQYILPTETTMAVNLEYGRVHSGNVSNLTGATYDYDEFYSVDYTYQFNASLRVIAEYSKVLTHYINGNYPVNTRYAVSTVFNF